jgi:sulfur-oxidizing protein SoxY
VRVPKPVDVEASTAPPGSRIGKNLSADRLTRRTLVSASAALALTIAVTPAGATEDDDDSIELVKRLTGKTPAVSDRLRLLMPATFPNGYTVPLGIEVEGPMTESDHVRYVRIVAPRNPLIEVATFHFVPGRSLPHVSTRIRLAEPQFILAVAELSNGALLMTKTWVDVATNGCA